MARRIERVQIAGPAGPLQGLLMLPEPSRAGAALLCHPHPRHGGTMHSSALVHAARALESLGLAVLRFNFRGAGQSAGSHTGGPGERRDAEAALSWLADRHPHEPLLVGGFSFGAWVGLAVGAERAGVGALIGIAPPLALYDFAFLEPGTTPLLCVAGDADPFCPVRALVDLQARLGPRLQLGILAGAGHLLATHPRELENAVRRFAATTLGDGPA